MDNKKILIVDDEKNIRMTLAQALQSEGWETDAAVNGEEALAKLEKEDFVLLLLDLKLPGIDGMEVLERVARERPDVRVIIITAHGSIESAVEAMKLGAVDYLQKPFSPKDIRDMVSSVMARDELGEGENPDYDTRLELAKNCINSRHFRAAEEHAVKAINMDIKKPEAFNLLGALLEMRGERDKAQKQYRIALDIAPNYKPARDNLERVTKWTQERSETGISLGEPASDSDKKIDERKKQDDRNI